MSRVKFLDGLRKVNTIKSFCALARYIYKVPGFIQSFSLISRATKVFCHLQSHHIPSSLIKLYVVRLEFRLGTLWDARHLWLREGIEDVVVYSVNYKHKYATPWTRIYWFIFQHIAKFECHRTIIYFIVVPGHIFSGIHACFVCKWWLNSIGGSGSGGGLMSNFCFAMSHKLNALFNIHVHNMVCVLQKPLALCILPQILSNASCSLVKGTILKILCKLL